MLLDDFGAWGDGSVDERLYRAWQEFKSWCREYKWESFGLKYIIFCGGSCFSTSTMHLLISACSSGSPGIVLENFQKSRSGVDSIPTQNCNPKRGMLHGFAPCFEVLNFALSTMQFQKR